MNKKKKRSLGHACTSKLQREITKKGPQEDKETGWCRVVVAGSPTFPRKWIPDRLHEKINNADSEWLFVPSR